MISKRVSWLHLIGFFIQFLAALSLSLNISPERARVKQDDASLVKVLCSADEALGACHFSWWAEKDSPGPVLDLSAGPASPVDRARLPEGLLDYEYSGAGMARGECGVQFKVKGKKLWTVGCRVRGLSGGWRYAWMDLVAYATDLLPNVATEQSTVVVFPGQDLNTICSATTPVDACYFSVPGIPGWLDFAKGLQSKDSTGRHVTRGKGLASGHCGLSLHGILEEDNGPVRCYVWKAPRFSDNRVVNVIVAKPPAAPTLEVGYEGGLMKATCSVSSSRPAVEIRWVLGDDVIRNDDENDAVTTDGDEWAWPWTSVGVTQNLTRRLEARDYGKILKCVISHVTLQQAVELSQVVTRSTGDESPRMSSPITMPVMRNEQGGTHCEPGSKMAATTCPQQTEYCELRLKEARHSAAAAVLAEQSAKVTLAAAQSAARAEEARSRAEEARALEEESWAKNAVEELDYDQERRNLTLRELRKDRAQR